MTSLQHLPLGRLLAIAASVLGSLVCVGRIYRAGAGGSDPDRAAAPGSMAWRLWCGAQTPRGRQALVALVMFQALLWASVP